MIYSRASVYSTHTQELTETHTERYTFTYPLAERGTNTCAHTPQYIHGHIHIHIAHTHIDTHVQT